MAFSLIYTFLLIATFLCGIELKSKHLYHCTYRLFTFSAMLQWSGILIDGVTWTKYAVTGLGPYPLAGGLMMGASEISFLALLLIMAKGYTITRGRLSTCSTIKLTVYINSYIVVYVSLFMFQALNFDPGEVLNLYESPAGFGLVLLRGCAWVVFMVSCIATVRKFPEKSSFYYPFGLLGSLWILAGPTLTMIGVALLDKWVRESVMFGALASCAFVGHAAFLWLTWPSRANKSFPYHVRTNHVGIINVNEDGTDFPRHTYAPSGPDQSYVIPLSSTTNT
jgi:Rhodopsin-like GPCR transmembrane domain